MYDESESYAPGALDDFFKRLSESNGTPGKPFYMPNGTPFFASASGTLLKKGLSEFDKLPDADRKPASLPAPKEDPARIAKSRRLTKPPEGTLILRSYVRGLKVDDKGLLHAPKFIDWDYKQKLPGEPNRDFVWLREAEWRSLIPANPEKGTAFAVPDLVRDRLCHWHIAGGYHGLLGYYTKDNFKSKEMSLTIEEASAKSVKLRLRGHAKLTTDVVYRFHGVLQYDLDKKAFTCFDVIALCDEGRDLERKPQNVAPYRHYGIAFELPGTRTDDLLPPFYLRENVGTPENYFRNGTR
jgi:hypothetical protein